MSTKCIDVSEHQGKINWTKVKKAGITHAIIRAGYGKNNTDARWKENIEGAIKAGIPNIGVYWFSYAYTLTMAVNEANYCYKHIKLYKDKINFAVWFDWEYDSMNYAKKMKAKTSKTHITNMHRAFCERIKALGMTPGFYYNWDYKKNHIDVPSLPYANWYALDDSNGKFTSVEIQQYGTEKVNGISGKVDANWVFHDPARKKQADYKDLPAIPSRGYFKLGDEGDAIKWIQKKLNAKNKGSILPKLKVDGKFNKKTLAQVYLFQDVRHLKIDGKVGVATLNGLDKAKVGKAQQAVNFAVSVARDNSYNYGVGKRAHNNGCPWCGTNITGKKKAKKGTKWEKTMCCNPFVHIAFAHGAGDERMLLACKKNSQAGLKPSSYTGRFAFDLVGKCKKVPYDKLKPGYLLLKEDSHIAIYTGDGWLVEAGKEGWDEKSIAHKKVAKGRYTDYAKRNDTYVIKYVG